MKTDKAEHPGSGDLFWSAESMLPRIFFWSGVSALFFQVAWQRLLTLYYGVGSVSITLIVSIYMIGLGIGALVGGRIADASPQRVRVYTLVELSLAVFGALSLWFLQFLGEHTAAANMWISLLCMCIFLCLPTIMMGMTLPLAVKIFDRPESENFLNSISFLYAINTIGATVGCLLCSYVVISFLGLDWAVYIASAIDAVLAMLIFSFGRRHDLLSNTTDSAADSAAAVEKKQPAISHNWTAYVILLTGFLAIGYEIVWFRFLQVLMKSSAYTFSTILAVYLAGLGLGSYAMNAFLQKRPDIDRRSAFFILQVLVGAYALASLSIYYWLTTNTDLAAFTAWTFSRYQGLRADEAALLDAWLLKFPWMPLFTKYDFIIWPSIFVLPATILMGGTFPLLSYLSLANKDQQGKTIGTIYFMNTVGNVLGGVVTGFLLLTYLGTERTLMVFSLLGVAMIFFVPSFGKQKLTMALRAAVFMGAAAVCIFVFPGKGDLWYTIHTSTTPPADRAKWRCYIQEGIDAVVCALDNGTYLRNYINGLTHGARGSTFMFQRETIEALARTENPVKVLIIGFGAGATLETLLHDQRVKDVTLVEICKTNLDNLGKIESIKKTLSDPRLTIIVEDGRRYLQTSKADYDLILIDPLRTTEAYSNNIYSKQFMQLLKDHLMPEGVALVWLDNFDILPNTINAVFPHIEVYNFFCLASHQPLKDNAITRNILLNTFDQQQKDYIVSVDMKLLFTGKDIRSKVQTERINEDWHPLTEYYLGPLLQHR